MPTDGCNPVIDAMDRNRHLYIQLGLTLTEILITLAVAAILLTVAVPPMQDFIIRNRMSTEVNTFIVSLHLARSEAVKRLQDVKVCPTENYTACTGNNDWKTGWMVFLDTDDNDSVDLPKDIVLQRNPAQVSRFRIIAGHRTGAVFQPSGQSGGSNNTFTFCDLEGVANTRKVYLSNEGRVRVAQIETSGCPVGDS